MSEVTNNPMRPVFRTRRAVEKLLSRPELTGPASWLDYVVFWLFLIGPLAISICLGLLMMAITHRFSILLLPMSTTMTFGLYAAEWLLLVPRLSKQESRATALANLPGEVDGAAESTLVAVSGCIRPGPAGVFRSLLAGTSCVFSSTEVDIWENLPDSEPWGISHFETRTDSRNFLLDTGSRVIMIDPSEGHLGVASKTTQFGEPPTIWRQRTAPLSVMRALRLDPLSPDTGQVIVVKENTISAGDRVVVIGVLVAKPGIDGLCLGSDGENALFLTCETREQLIARIACQERSWRWLAMTLAVLLLGIGIVCAFFAWVPT